MSQGEIFTKYRALFSASSITPFESESIKKINDLKFVDFLFELIKATKGQNKYKDVLLKGVFSELKNKRDINTQIKKIFKDFFACEQNVIIPEIYTVNSSAGLSMDLSEIDPNGLLQVDPNTQLGKHLYEGNDIEKHINFIFHKSLTSTKDKPLSYKYKARELFQVYSSNSNTIVFKFGSYYSNRPVYDWVLDYLDSTDFFNLPNFTSTLMDLLTGAISIKAGKGKLEIKEDSKLISALKKIFGFCSENDNSEVPDSSLSTYLNNNQNNESDPSSDVFNFNSLELSEIETDATDRSNSVIRFTTCNELEVFVDPENVLIGLDYLFGAFSNSPGDNIDSVTPTPFDNINTTFNIDNATNLFNEILKPGTEAIIADGETDLKLSYPNMQAELHLGVFKAIPYALVKSLITPKLLLLSKITSEINKLNGTSSSGKVNTNVVIESILPVVKSVGLDMIDRILKNIFDEIKKDITKLTKDLAVTYIKQRGGDYISTLTSLLKLIKKKKSNETARCQSTISKLLSLLNLGNFGPMPSVPGPLILIGGKLKPGLNKVAMVNDLKAKLQKKGIETAPFFQDGTPNYMMYMMEEMMDTIVEHIKTRSKIDVFAIGPTGPIQGNGQIQ